MQEQNLGNGVWVKTHFYREGHMLHSVTYCCVAGNPEVLRFAVDMRPIARAVAKYHEKLHERARQNPDKHARLQAPAAEVGGLFDVIAAPFKGIGHAVASVAKVKLVKKITGAVTKVVNKVTPDIVKKVVAVTVSATPFHFVENVLAGQRIDKAALGDLKSKISAATGIAPYVSTVAAMLPGIGTGAAAAIAASASLAEGHPITEIMLDAARAAVPGGAAGQLVFDTARNVAKGGNLALSVVEAARNQVPTALRPAFDVGIAMTHAKSIQDALKKGATAALPSAGAALERYSGPALAAFATAHDAFDAIDAGKTALAAVKNIKNAGALVSQAEAAVKKLGIADAQKTFQKYPALADKLRTAVAVKDAAKKLSPAEVKAALSKAQEAVNAISKIAEQAKSDPDPARRTAAAKSVKILEIVAHQRGQIGAVAAANAGGIPGIQIDAHGNLIRGRFVRATGGAADSFLYAKQGGGHGNWSRVSTDSTTPSRAAAIQHAAAASSHAAMAVAHREAAQVDKKAAPAHAKQAALHAKKAVAHKNAAAKISGALSAMEPGLIGCACH